MAHPMRAANRKPVPKYMMDSSIERRAGTYGHLNQWMLPRVVAGRRYHAQNGIDDCRKARERRLCGVLAVKLWRSNPAPVTDIRPPASRVWREPAPTAGV